MKEKYLKNDNVEADVEASAPEVQDENEVEEANIKKHHRFFNKKLTKK